MTVVVPGGNTPGSLEDVSLLMTNVLSEAVGTAQEATLVRFRYMEDGHMSYTGASLSVKENERNNSFPSHESKHESKLVCCNWPFLYPPALT